MHICFLLLFQPRLLAEHQIPVDVQTKDPKQFAEGAFCFMTMFHDVFGHGSFEAQRMTLPRSSLLPGVVMCLCANGSCHRRQRFHGIPHSNHPENYEKTRQSKTEEGQEKCEPSLLDAGRFAPSQLLVLPCTSLCCFSRLDKGCECISLPNLLKELPA